MKSRKLLFILLTLFASMGYGQVRLELNLEEGASYRQITNSDATIVQDLMGQSLEINVSLIGEMQFTVREATSDHYLMDVTFERMQMTMGSPQGSASFDSDNPQESDPMSNVLSSITGNPFEIKMSKTGKVLEINKVDQLWESAFEDQALSPADKQRVMGQLNQTYGAEALKGNIEMVTAIFPETAVSKGDSWSTTTQLSSGMQGTAITTYTFNGSEGDRHLLTGSGTIESSDNEEYINTNGVDLKFNMSGQMESSIEIEKSTGWIKVATVNQTIEGTAQMKGNEQLPDGLTIPMKIQNSQKTTDQ
ncbi:MAG: DUF6263 family protein [Bacteroidota bacterium]